jgi:hypothetical protein
MRLIIALLIVLASLGCARKVSQAYIPPVAETLQSTTGVIQYDYKAGRPDEVKSPPAPRVDSVNPYLIPEYIDWEKYFPKQPDSPSTGSSSGGGGTIYVVIPTVFWSGVATVTVE